MVFNDYFLTFYDRSKNYDERLKAGFEAAKMALVMEDGAPLLCDDDEDALKGASVVPYYRLFNEALAETREVETAKKN